MHFSRIIKLFTLFTKLQGQTKTFLFILISKTNSISSETSKGPFWYYLCILKSSVLQPQATQKHLLLPELNESIKRNKCCQWLPNTLPVIGKEEDKTGFAKQTSHSLSISTQYGWLSTQELLSRSPKNKYAWLMNENVFAFAIHSDLQWLMCSAMGHNEKKNHKNLIISTYNKLPLLSPQKLYLSKVLSNMLGWLRSLSNHLYFWKSLRTKSWECFIVFKIKSVRKHIVKKQKFMT